MKDHPEYNCLIDRLGVISALRALSLQKGSVFAEVWYCSATRFFNFLLSFDFIKKRIPFRHFSYEFGAISSADNGEGVYWRWNRDVSSLSIDIMKRSQAGGHLLLDLDPRYNKDKIRLFLTQKIYADIDNTVKLILIVSSAKTALNSNGLPVVLVAKDTVWSAYLMDYGLGKGVAVRTYPSAEALKMSISAILKFFAELVVNSLDCLARQAEIPLRPKQPMIAVPYLNGIDVNRKNDVFWFGCSGIEPGSIQLFFRNYLMPLTDEIDRKINRMGFKKANLLFGLRNRPYLSFLNGKVNVFPTGYFVKSLLKTSLELLKLFARSVLRFDRLKVWQSHQIGLLLSKVIFYESYFKRNNVKILFSLMGVGDDLVASNMAVELAGGVEISAQWTNIPAMHIYLVCPHDVYFSWGPYYKEVFQALPSLTEYLIYCGYIYDSTFSPGRDRALAHRKALSEQNVDFVITYFDEQYSKDGCYAKSSLEGLYSLLFSELISDTRLGLIIKRKRDASFSRLDNAGVDSLFRQALRSGRCVVFSEGQFPNEAAQASDLAIGLGVFNTAALEAYLSGVPFMTFDSCNMKSHPYYNSGYNKIVFDDFNCLIRAVREARKACGGPFLRGLSVDSDLISRIDPFRDGRASERVGAYLKYLLDGFTRGEGRYTALSNANKTYSEKFGTDKVLNFNTMNPSLPSGN